MMSAPYRQFVDNTDHGQEAVTSAVRSGADTVQNLTNELTSGRPQFPGLQGVVEQYFDLAEQVLAHQREFARQWASATGKAFGAVNEQAKQSTEAATAHAATAAEAVVENAAETARVAHDDAVATTLAVRDATSDS
jgi:hypothetical protein